MMGSLKHKMIHALSRSFFDAVAQKGVQFVVGVVLARLLPPEQFVRDAVDFHGCCGIIP